MSQKFEKNGDQATPQKRKTGIFAFILCLLIAFVIWLYAAGVENAKLAEGEETENSSLAACVSVASEWEDA